MTERLFSIHCFSLCCLLVAASHFRFAQAFKFHRTANGPVRRIVEQPCIRRRTTPDGNRVEWPVRLRDILRGVDAFPYVIDFFRTCQDFSQFQKFFGPTQSLCDVRLISITLHRVESCRIPPFAKTAKDGAPSVWLSGQAEGELASDGQSAENPDHV